MDTTLTSDTNHSEWWRTLLRPLTSSAGYRALTHNLVGFPLGIAYFVWLVTGVTTGLGLAITLIGLPILTLVFASIRPLLWLERTAANTLLDAGIPDGPLTPGGTGVWERAKAYWTDSATWRGGLYLLARFPIGLATFTVATAAYSAALALIAGPVLAPLDGVELGVWEPDTVIEGLALTPAGLLLLPVAGWISTGMGALSRAFARWGARAA